MKEGKPVWIRYIIRNREVFKSRSLLPTTFGYLGSATHFCDRYEDTPPKFEE